LKLVLDGFAEMGLARLENWNVEGKKLMGKYMFLDF
jgi:hypothetical protein